MKPIVFTRLGAMAALGLSLCAPLAAQASDFLHYLNLKEGWQTGTSVELRGDSLTLNEGDDKPAIVYGEAGAEPLVSNVELGDRLLKLEYTTGPDTRASVYLQGRYALELGQNAGNLAPARGNIDSGLPAQTAVDAEAGEWRTLVVRFRGPRYNDASQKVENAMIIEARIDGELVQKNALRPGLTEGAIEAWETTSGPTLFRVESGALALRNFNVQPADYSKITLPEESGGETNEAELVDYVAKGKKAFLALGCKECHAVERDDNSMKTGPNLYGLFKKTPRDREIEETAEEHRFTVQADMSYLRRSIRSPEAELAVVESGDKKGETYMPVMPPYMKQTLPDKQLDAIGYYLQTLNNSWDQGPAEKLVESSGPTQYDPLEDDLQFLVDDRVRIQRGPMEGLSARAIHVGQPNAVNYSFDPRFLGIAKLWQGGFLDMTGELTNRGGGGLKTGYQTREIKLGEAGLLFAPLNAEGELIDFSFKEAVFNDTDTIREALWSERDHLDKIEAVDAAFLGYRRPSASDTAPPSFHYRVGDNDLWVSMEIGDKGQLTVEVNGERGSEQAFRLNAGVIGDASVSAGQLEDSVWQLPAGEGKARLSGHIALAGNAWQPEPSDFDHERQKLTKVDAVADLPAGYTVENYLPPQDNYGRDQLFEALGLAVADDGTIVVATRTAGVWRIEDGEWQLFAEGLFDSLGVQIEDKHGRRIVVGQKPELTRLTDTDGDGRADRFDTLFDAHSYFGNYHTYMHGPARDPQGNYYISLNLAHADEAVYKAGGKYMGSQGGLSGWGVKVSPQGDYELFASGLRSPAGLATGPEGRLWYTENQGEFVGTSKLFELKEGRFYGHPSGLVDKPGMTPDSPQIEWEKVADTRERAAVLFPHNRVANAPGNPVWDTTDGAFGPFDGQMLVGDQTQSNLLRVTTETVNGQRQGAVMPFLSGLASGVMRGLFLPDNSLLLGQTGRGWQAKGGHVASLQRIRWDGETRPAAIKAVNATSNGFELELTQPLRADLATPLSEALTIKSWAYRDAPDYGSPELGMRDESAEVSVSDNRRRIRVVLAETDQPELHPQQTARVYHLSLTAKGLFYGPERETLDAYYSLYAFPGDAD